MKKEFKQFIEAAKGLTLSSEEKAFLKRSLFGQIGMVPHAPYKKIASPYAFILGEKGMRRISMVIAPVLVFSLMATTIFAAEAAIPGDMLYTVKLNVNEKVVSTLATTPQSKAGVEASLAARRLAEIEKVAVSKETDKKHITTLKKSFETHVKNTQENIKKIEEEGDNEAALKASTEFQAILSAHSKIIDDVADSNDDHDVKEKLDNLKDKIQEEENKTTEYIDEVKEKVTEDEEDEEKERRDAEAEKKRQEEQKIVDKRIENLEEQIKELKEDGATSASIKKVERLLKHAKRSDDRKISTQHMLLDDVDRAIEEAKIILEAKEELEIEHDPDKDHPDESTEPNVVEASTTPITATSTATTTVIITGTDITATSTVLGTTTVGTSTEAEE